MRIASLHRNKRAWAAAFKATFPVLLGYTTLGSAFGLLLVNAGLPWWLAPVMSVAVYAGAAQFMAIGLLAAGRDILEIALLTLAINARHAVYGLSLLGSFEPCRAWKPYLVFGLTDETYGLLATVEPPQGSSQAEGEAFYAAITLLDQSYWILGTIAGAAAGIVARGIEGFDAKGLDFALTALFVVLLVEQVRAVRRFEPYLVAAAAAALAFLALGPEKVLLAAILLSIAGLATLRGRLP
jgi:4-azaleucine resistance transporter AzlC